ncbi:MAG: glutamine-hydrolyzing GMP synthase [Firmicutes bacterium]|nr:glutamine-hydrolyzing GMP synthase [Candidatus Fermentithermobacillaceae bacterium]
MRNQVIILDFGAQYTQLIARSIRELKVYCQVIPGDAPVSEIRACVDPLGQDVPGAIILSGGPDSVYEEGVVLPDPAIFELGCPVLGICYGMQAMAKVLGGSLARGPAGGAREYGPEVLRVAVKDGIFEGFPEETRVWMSCGDTVDEVPRGFSVTGSTENTKVAAMADPVRKLFGVGFHPEVKNTALGRELIANFLFRVASLEPDWTMGRFVERTVREIREKVGDAHVVAGVSGGVDSTVCAVLVHKAIGDKLHPILVDHGLMRQDEAAYVVDAMARLGVGVKLVNAEERFLSRLRGVTDPERKRKIIGEEFIRVFEEEAEKLGGVEYILQGTIYPDVIESGSRTRNVIKSHHNVGGLPERMNLRLLEPIRELFKDEVRLLGKELGLSDEFVGRHPFPGPGLAVRVLGEITREKLDVVRKAQAILDEEIRRAGLYEELWQCFCVLPNVRTVGVMEDRRTYGHVVAIRAVHSEDAMTAEWARLPYEVLERVSTRIVNEVHDATRVVLDITSKPPSTIEWE